MFKLREWTRRMWETLHRSRRDREMEEELRSHLEFAAEEMQRRSGATEDAARAARLQFGGVTQAMEATKEASRGWTILHGMSVMRRGHSGAVRSLPRSQC